MNILIIYGIVSIVSTIIILYFMKYSCYTETEDINNIKLVTPAFKIENGIKIIIDPNDPLWKYFPELKTKVIFGESEITYMNYEEYYFDFLLCDPNPDKILKIK